MSRKVVHVEIDGRDLALSNLDKVLYPQSGFTKAQAIDYYVRIAPAILPHLKDRPLTLKRYPEGVNEEFFYEKRCPGYHPEWIDIAEIPTDRSGTIRYCTVDSVAALVWVVNLASLEMHTLLAKMQRPSEPTMMVFDLDPGDGNDIISSCRVAQYLRAQLEHMSLESFPKTSGGKGLHLYVPLNTPVTHEQTKTLAHELANRMMRDRPDEVTSNMRKSLRGGKVFIDWSQNDSHKTTVCAYSLRARAEPTVSTPVSWSEVDAALRKEDPTLLYFQAEDVVARMEKSGDLFEPVLTIRQRLP